MTVEGSAARARETSRNLALLNYALLFAAFFFAGFFAATFTALAAALGAAFLITFAAGFLAFATGLFFLTAVFLDFMDGKKSGRRHLDFRQLGGGAKQRGGRHLSSCGAG